MAWQEEFIEALQMEFAALRKRNPRFSVRAFAKKTGLAPGPLSQTLRQKKKWNIRASRAVEILERLQLPASRKNRLLVRMGQAPSIVKRALPQSDHQLLTDWTYYPILFSFDLPAALAQPRAIAKRLGITEIKVNEVIRDLTKRGFLTRAKNGKITKADVAWKSGDGPPSSVLRRHHEMNLELSARALRQLPVERRDFTSLTFAGNENQLAFLREEIRRLHERASSLMDDESGNSAVYRLSVQLYPMEFS